MSSLLESTNNLMQVFSGKLEDFLKEIDNVHMVWLEEIEQEAQRMFSSDFNTEPELMPKTPSQKKTSRRRRVSVGNENKAKRRLSKGKRSNLRRSSVQLTLNVIPESPTATADPEVVPEDSVEEPQRRTRRNNTKSAAAQGPVKRSTRNKLNSASQEEVEDDIFEDEKPIQEEGEAPVTAMETEPVNSVQPPHVSSPTLLAVNESEEVEEAQVGRASVSKMTTAEVQETPQGPSRTSVRRSMSSRHSLAGLRRSMTQEAVRRASRRSFLKKKARLSRSAGGSSVGEDICFDTDGEEVEEMEREEKVGDVEEPAVIVTEASPVPEIKLQEPDAKDPEEKEEEQMLGKSGEAVTRYTRSMAKNTPTNMASGSASRIEKTHTPLAAPDDSGKKPAGTQSLSRFGFKRRVDSTSEDVPKKKVSPKISQSAVRPNMKSFIHTVQKNQLLMMTPGSMGRTSVMSFIKHSTPGRVDPKERERMKLEAFNKKSEQENERKKKMEDERRKKHEELKKQREERLRRVLEARERGEKEEFEKRKKLEQKMAQFVEKDKAKKIVASKRQQELEVRRNKEEEARKKKLQQDEEEKRQLELRAKRKAEEEDRARKLADARRQLELKRDQERELERQAAERERQEREKAIALQVELERAARDKERKELDEKRRLLDEKRKREDEQRRAEDERRRAAAAAVAAAHEAQNAQLKAAASKGPTLLNTTINKGSALNVTVDLEGMRTPVGKGAALYHMSVQKGAALNITVDVEKTVNTTPVGKSSEPDASIELCPNVTIDLERSPQSYEITPKGKKITTLVNPEDYGMDQNSDDSTDDESAPKKPIPSWAEGLQLQQSIMKQYYDPTDLHAYFGVVEMPKLERIFNKSKPRFFKRTSSAVWHSPPRMGSLAH
ncbi:inner centromere protein isoform X2 [Clupea harengus]|uniref:Inner centromere protein isoform X2 n=1 Tax=Clupea harengus TaxID=7950 RepID=A0A6P8FAE5_CLUHA|nr:inner centromere protein isoform X2 [Clupea harengus]